MDLLYTDNRIVVCLKPAGVLSTDEPGGMPELLRRALGEDGTGCVRVVHRLDRPVGGVMVYARSRMADSILSRQVQAHTFEKDYLAVLEGVPAQASGVLEDQLRRDTAARRTCVADAPGPLGLWSYRIAFCHPQTGRPLQFSHLPPAEDPWLPFQTALSQLQGGPHGQNERT